MSRAANNMDPVEINASGYDLVVVDTPHFVKICGIDPRRVLTVVHDLIPLRDPTMGADWRYLFIKKIQASLALDGNLIFASNFTRDTFRANFPDWKTRRELVLYPSIRSSLIRAAASPRRALTLSRPVESPSEPIADKPGDRRGRGLARKLRKAWKMKKLTYPDGRGKTGWDATLPYFATMVSDEPRKNIGILIEAFQKLQGRANMVIMGQVDATRYLRADEVPYIHFAGYVSEADKIEVLRGAAGVIFPSFSEGFGIPLVEGAVVGAPVLCSNIAVFREVAGDHAVYFDPYAPDSLSAAIERVLADPVGCAEMTALLRESAITRFSQAAMAQRLVATLAELGLPTRPATGALAELAGVQEAALGAPRASVANDRG
jgi:glycosyltransferase involved in cell wall biosynthesis